MALSLVEAEYMEASQDACEAIWMRKILVGLFGSHMDPTVIHSDNKSCIKLSINPVFHDRSKNIDIWYHHLRLCVEENHLASVHSHGRSGCIYFDEGAHQEKI